MINVRFNSGIEEIDKTLSEAQGFARVFEAINLNKLTEETHPKGQPIVHPTVIEVAPFTDMDDNMAYAIKSYRDLADDGRMILSDFQVSQRWTQVAGKNILSLVAEDQSVIYRDLGSLTVPFAMTADVYRLGHYVQSR